MLISQYLKASGDISAVDFVGRPLMERLPVTIKVSTSLAGRLRLPDRAYPPEVVFDDGCKGYGRLGLSL
jgi:hypothetical protein